MQADGTTLACYANDLARQEISSTTRQTWTLDAVGRLGAWTNNDGTWTRTATKTNHYGGDTDSPDWTVEAAGGSITRDVQGMDGDLVATTDATGNTVLQLTNMHGDAVVQYPLDTPRARSSKQPTNTATSSTAPPPLATTGSAPSNAPLKPQQPDPHWRPPVQPGHGPVPPGGPGHRGQLQQLRIRVRRPRQYGRSQRMNGRNHPRGTGNRRRECQHGAHNYRRRRCRRRHCLHLMVRQALGDPQSLCSVEGGQEIR